jgi:RNA polymerase sigma factor for flagellar operon FliA
MRRCACAAPSSTSCGARTGGRAPCARTATRCATPCAPSPASLGREPNDREAAEALGIGQDEWRRFLLDDVAEELLSFDEVLQEAAAQQHSTPGPEEQFMVRRSLEQALGALNEKEQRVIQMIYEFELSYKEIAAVLDLSDARVCQLNKSALAKMKAALVQA